MCLILLGPPLGAGKAHKQLLLKINTNISRQISTGDMLVSTVKVSRGLHRELQVINYWNLCRSWFSDDYYYHLVIY